MALPAAPQAKGASKGPAKGSAKGPNYNSGLYQPGQILSGKALGTAATQIANSQINPVVKSLTQQRATNNTNNQNEQRTDFNYYMQLAQAAKDSVTQAQNIGTGLQGTLAGNAAQAQSQLGQLGQASTGGALARMNALGLDAGQTAALGAETARQQGIGTLNAQTAANFGAQQSANIAGQANTDRGATGLAGTQAIGALSRAGVLANLPINQQIAAEQDKRGALTSTALGQLRSQERNYQIAQEGLGVKTASLNATVQNNNAKNKIAQQNATTAQQRNAIDQQNNAQRNAITSQNDLQNQLLRAAQIRTTAQNDQANQALKQAALNVKQSAAGKPKALTTNQQNLLYGDISRIQALIAGPQKDAQGNVLNEAEVRSHLQSGLNPSKRAYPAVLVEAAYEMKGWGHLLPKTAAALNAMGLRGGRLPVKALQAPGGILGAVGSAA